MLGPRADVTNTSDDVSMQPQTASASHRARTHTIVELMKTTASITAAPSYGQRAQHLTAPPVYPRNLENSPVTVTPVTVLLVYTSPDQLMEECDNRHQP